MEKLVTQYHWLQLPYELRSVLVEVFNIPKSSGVVMQDSKVLTDGYTQEDLKHITTDKMKEYVGTDVDVDFNELFELTIKKAETELAKRKQKEQLAKQEAYTDQMQEVFKMKAETILKTLLTYPQSAQLHVYLELDARLNGTKEAQKQPEVPVDYSPVGELPKEEQVVEPETNNVNNN